MFPPMIADTSVDLELIAYQPWPLGEVLRLGDVLFGEPGRFPREDGRYRLTARVEGPDDENATLAECARSVVRTSLQMLRQALPRYTLDLGTQYHIQRRSQPGGTGAKHITASATVIINSPLTAAALEPARRLATTFGEMNSTQQRRSRAAVYWLEQSRSAPDAAQRLPAACFSIEAAIGAPGNATPKDYVKAIQTMNYTITQLNVLERRVDRIVQVRASIVHNGNLDAAMHEPEAELWSCDLARAVVLHKLGMPTPTTLAILNSDTDATGNEP